MRNDINNKPLKGIAVKSKCIPVKDRGTVSVYDLKPGMDLSEHIKGSYLIFNKFTRTERVKSPVTGRIKTTRYGEFKCKSCGSVVERNIRGIVRGTVRSCGCMGRYEDFKPGERFGHLTVLDKPRVQRPIVFKHKNGKTYHSFENLVETQCDCGNIYIADPRALRKGHSITCNKCYNPRFKDSYKPDIYERCRTLAKRYDKIKARTRNPDNDSLFVTYGLHNITLDIELYDFIDAFYQIDMDYKNLQVDRIDGDKPYRLDNIRWVTSKENSNNKKPYSEYTTTDVSYRLFPLSRFEQMCKVNGWVSDHFYKIPFPLFSSGSSRYYLVVHRDSPMAPVAMVYYYIDIAKRLSDNMPSNKNRIYLYLKDENDNDVNRTTIGWKDTYKITAYRPGIWGD